MSMQKIVFEIVMRCERFVNRIAAEFDQSIQNVMFNCTSCVLFPF